MMIKSYLEEKIIPVEKDLKDNSLRFKRMSAILYKLEIYNGAMVVRKQEGELEIDDFRLIIPHHMEERLVTIIHEQFGLHQG